jgi:hypothetical protein
MVGRTIERMALRSTRGSSGTVTDLGFRPSRNGFHFANRWPPTPAWTWGLGMIHLGFGNAARGLCGGLAYAARDRFDAGLPIPQVTDPPPAGTGLFREIVRRQVDSFDRLVVVPWRFWRSAAAPASLRVRETLLDAWPRIHADLEAGHPSAVGLIRTAGLNPLRLSMGHQVLAFADEEHADRITVRVYDPNHPDDDSVELRIERNAGRQVRLSQSTGEPLLGLLALPYIPPGRAWFSRLL